jgi:hypothetical protein
MTTEQDITADETTADATADETTDETTAETPPTTAETAPTTTVLGRTPPTTAETPPGSSSEASAVGGRTPPSAVGGRTPPSTVLGRTPPYEYPALCIPRGLGKITHEELTTIINQSGLGEVSKIIIKPKEFVLPKWERTVSHHLSTADSDADTPQTVCYNNIYIYFKKWNTDNPNVRKYRDNIINGKSIKIVHKTIPTPIFWRCVAANFSSSSSSSSSHRPEISK